MSVPVVLWDNVADTGGFDPLGANTEILPGFPAENLFSPFTYSADSFMFERGDATGSISIRFTAYSSFDTIGFIIYGTDGESFSGSISPLPGSSFKLFSINRDGVYLISFPSRAAGNYQMFISSIPAASSDSSIIVIPVMMVGTAMPFEKCIRNRYAPLDYSRKTEFLTNESGTGQYIGRSIIRRNHESTVSFDLMTAPWVRSTFQPFVRHARTKPYFFAWNPEKYPDEVNYVWTDEDIVVEYTGDRDRMSASWSMRGLGNDQE